MYDTSDKQVVREIIEEYSNMVYRLALSRVKSKENAEDIYQEVFFRLSRSKPLFTDKEHTKAWLIRVTINCSKSFLSSSWFKHTTPLEQEIKFETKEKHDVYYAVMELPQKYRTIIHLFYYEGLKITEIGKVLKLNESTVKTRLSRARNKLKELMKGGFEDE